MTYEMADDAAPMYDFDIDYATSRLDAMRHRARERDQRQLDVLAMRRGDYEAVAPGMMPEDFDRALVANLIDTAAHDLSEVMAPLPSLSCASSSQTSQTKKDFANKRALIANSYVQRSKLAKQMYGLADRYISFGYGTYIVEPDFKDKTPVIRADRSLSSYFALDYRDRVVQYVGLSRVHCDELCHLYPHMADAFRTYVHNRNDKEIEVAEWYDKKCLAIFVPEMKIVLNSVPNVIGRPPIGIVGRPSLDSEQRGQFDDVIGVQIGRAIIATYTMSAVQQSVEAPIAMPQDVQDLELGPFSAITSNSPEKIGRVNLSVPPGLFPEQQVLAQEQRIGSRYPEGRSGNVDASIITGQGVQALMGTFDTQIQTFQRLNEDALEDVISMCFEMDEALWPATEKSVRVMDAGSPVEITYRPSKDIKSDYSVDVNYGAVAGLDPNRALIFILQTISGGMMSRETGQKHLPIEMDHVAELRRMDLEAIRDSTLGAVAALAQAIPQMAANGQDPREIVMQMAEVIKLREKGDTIDEAVAKVFAPKEQPAPPVNPEMDALAAAQAAGAQPPAGPGGPQIAEPQSPGQDLLMQLAGISPSGGANLQANVSRMQPAR